MENRERICAFTGHRPERLPFGADDAHPEAMRLKIRIFEEILKEISDGCTRFMTGCARGADILCGELVLNMKVGAPRLQLICVVPFEDQADS